MYITMTEFEQIATMNKSQYHLPMEIEKTIRILSKLIGTPVFDNDVAFITNSVNVNKFAYISHSKQRFDKPQYQSSTNTTGDWSTTRNFKPTILQKKEGIEKEINDIRISLNKISNKNYEIHRDNILQIITFVDNKSPESLPIIAKSIFDIARNNKFYSELYADLYKELTQKFDVFIDLLDECIENYRNTIHDIVYIDANVDYDGYCVYTKSNEQRKAMASFIIMLVERKLLDKENVIQIIIHFQSTIVEYIDQEGKTNEVDEISENVFIFVNLGMQHLSMMPSWNTCVVPAIEHISKMKGKEHVSLTSRAIFKYMDISNKVK
jgi:hypothetical protein